MLGVSGLMGSSDDGAATAAAAETTHENGGSSDVGGSSSIPDGGVEEGERTGGGNRWPRQETLALLKIRSDMDVAFRDSSLKGPLWEEVSRKMAELGFQRSSKKCREKFENVYKYHKRTKDGRAAKSDGKTYRFFDQLEALENTTFALPPPAAAAAITLSPNAINSSMPAVHVSATVSSISPTPLSVVPPPPAPAPQAATNNLSSQLRPSQSPLMNPAMAVRHHHHPHHHHNNNNNSNNNSSAPPQSHSFQHQPSHHPHHQLSSSTSSSTSSDDDIQRRRGRKRKWKECFQRLMREVIQKQEELQKKFLDTLEKREHDRMSREEAWRVQEMARMNREHDLLVQERSMAAAKDAAVIAFLQKVTDQHNLQIPITVNTNAPTPQAAPNQAQPQDNNPPPARQPEPPPPPPPQQSPLPPTKNSDAAPKADNGGSDHFFPASSSRWPKSEVQALIDLRTNMDLKYQENGPKGPLWEDISSAMAKLGYNRSAKRCKEKWENINKYFKKVKESSKKRPEDSKTCPYFHQLEAIYKEKARNDIVVPFINPEYAAKPVESSPMVPIMAQPEQQWPFPDHSQRLQNPDHDSDGSDDRNLNDEYDEEDDDGDDEGVGYEIISNKPPPQSNPVANAAQES